VSRAPRDDGAHAPRNATADELARPDEKRAVAWSRELCERLGAPRDPISVTAAMRELFAVHRAEQARLLHCALRLRCAAMPLGNLFLELRARAESEPHWRSEAVEEIDAILLDGWDVCEPLWECASRPRHAWRSARELARAALELEPSSSGELHRAHAELGEGTPRPAIDRLRRLAHAPLAPEMRRAVLEGLALAYEASGELRAACAQYAIACRAAGASEAVLAAWLALALATDALGDVEPLRWRRSASAASSRWDASDGSRLRGRIEHHRRAGRWRMSDRARHRALEWAEGDDSLRRAVAWAVL